MDEGRKQELKKLERSFREKVKATTRDPNVHPGYEAEDGWCFIMTLADTETGEHTMLYGPMLQPLVDTYYQIVHACRPAPTLIHIRRAKKEIPKIKTTLLRESCHELPYRDKDNVRRLLDERAA